MYPERIVVKPRPDLFEAARDFFFLLERGYSRKPALDLISSRRLLSKTERLLLYRSVHPSGVAASRASKRLEPGMIRGTRVAVDGFNVISTVASAIIGDTLIRGNDGFIRDLAATRRKVKASPIYFLSMNVAAEALARLEPESQVWVFDSQISRSASFAAAVEVWATPVLSRNADATVVELANKGYVAVTSDSVILDRVDAAFDLGGFLAQKISPNAIVDLSVPLREMEECLSHCPGF